MALIEITQLCSTIRWAGLVNAPHMPGALAGMAGSLGSAVPVDQNTICGLTSMVFLGAAQEFLLSSSRL